MANSRFPVVLLGLIVWLLAGLADGRAENAAGIRASGLHLVAGNDTDSAAIVVDLGAEVSLRWEALDRPDRLVIDLERVVFVREAARGVDRATGPVGAVRAGLVLSGQSRIVVDLVRPAVIERQDFVRQNGRTRLVLLVRAVPAERFAARAAEDSAARLAARAPSPVPPPRADGKPLVVIDPGHGGVDPGAAGPRGELEKEIVLDAAKALAAELRRSGKVAVAMTREDDRFLALDARVRFAREKGASVLVSLHADTLAGEPDVRGASVYTLAERATDAAAARAAEKENRADLVAGLPLEEEARDGVGDILIDLARRETRAYSQRVAREAADALGRSTILHKTPLRGAGFRVLRSPDFPSILIELGYLSNKDDLAALRDSRARGEMARSLARALESFALATRSPGAGARVP